MELSVTKTVMEMIRVHLETQDSNSYQKVTISLSPVPTTGDKDNSNPYSI